MNRFKVRLDEIPADVTVEAFPSGDVRIDLDAGTARLSLSLDREDARTLAQAVLDAVTGR
jgi:hypothetical protein